MSVSLPISALREALLAWFAAKGRSHLPWRVSPAGRRDPYAVWVAEILLQQTQVSRGLLYYQNFLNSFPTVHDLAAAPLDAVLKAWEGCGYYSRARNLHRAAQLVAEQGFPRDYAGWLALPGVGPYTAAAIASLALGEARAVNDGNVRRVLARLYAEARPTEVWLQEQADAMLDSARPGDWNEALMDLGATICTPKGPLCAECPLARFCAALQTGNPTAFPAPKVRSPIQEVRAVAVLIGDEHSAVLEQRRGKLLGGLYGLPLEQQGTDETVQETLTRLCQRLQATPGERLGQVQHAMTHRRITLEVYRAHSAGPRSPVQQAALSRLDHKALYLLTQRQASLFRLKD